MHTKWSRGKIKGKWIYIKDQRSDIWSRSAQKIWSWSKDHDLQIKDQWSSLALALLHDSPPWAGIQGSSCHPAWAVGSPPVCELPNLIYPNLFSCCKCEWSYPLFVVTEHSRSSSRLWMLWLSYLYHHRWTSSIYGSLVSRPRARH